jgi:hypothetical protein
MDDEPIEDSTDFAVEHLPAVVGPSGGGHAVVAGVVQADTDERLVAL